MSSTSQSEDIGSPHNTLFDDRPQLNPSQQESSEGTQNVSSQNSSLGSSEWWSNNPLLGQMAPNATYTTYSYSSVNPDSFLFSFDGDTLSSYFPQASHIPPAPSFVDSALGSAYSETGNAPINSFSVLPIPPNTNLQPPPPAPSSTFQNIQPFPQLQQLNGLFFSTYDHAMTSFPSPTWRCPANDNTLPENDRTRRKWVRKLLNAVNNIQNVHDKQGVIFKRRWYNPVTGPSTFYSHADKELLCWDILDLTERLHLRGPGVFHSFDPIFWRQAAKTKDWTFGERIEHIIELLTFSKARCEKLLAGMTLRMVIANPMVLIMSTKGNAKQNGRRQAFLEAGRAAKKRRVDGKSEEEKEDE